jgi:exosortase/archaeosortase family protein
VNGRLVIVDAPCAGVHMGWAAYFAACAAAAWLRLPTRALLTRLPAVGVAVLAGNVVRNTVLVAGEASDGGLAAWRHEAIGIVVFAAVCAFVLSHVSRAAHTHGSREPRLGG